MQAIFIIDQQPGILVATTPYEVKRFCRHLHSKAPAGGYFVRSYLQVMAISSATIADIPALESLINSGYRGHVSLSGWTSEAHLIKGEIRTNKEELALLMQKPGSVFIKYTGGNGQIEGCVYLHQEGSKMYLGMLTVSPLLQAKGIGKKLMHAAQLLAEQKECRSIYMRVISLRHELIAWYEKQGFEKNGQREDFPRDNKFGTPVTALEFLILEKLL